MAWALRQYAAARQLHTRLTAPTPCSPDGHAAQAYCQHLAGDEGVNADSGDECLGESVLDGAHSHTCVPQLQDTLEGSNTYVCDAPESPRHSSFAASYK